MQERFIEILAKVETNLDYLNKSIENSFQVQQKHSERIRSAEQKILLHDFSLKYVIVPFACVVFGASLHLFLSKLFP